MSELLVFAPYKSITLRQAVNLLAGGDGFFDGDERAVVVMLHDGEE